MEPSEMSKPEKNKSVLIVDNDRDVRDILQGLITHQGHDVLTAQRASDAAKIIGSKPVDLLLLDIRMPGPHGHHLLTYLKKRNKNVPPTIVVSGFLEEELIPELIRLGVNGIVAKPFDPKRLCEEIGLALEGVSEEIQICAQCGQSTKAGDRFCRRCGKEIVFNRKCKSCDKEYQEGDLFCGGCGLKLR